MTDEPAKIGPSGWRSIVKDVFPRWRDRLGSKEAASDLEALLRDPETRSAIRYVDASGKEVPGTPKYLDAEFWRDRLLLVPDADGGADHLVVDYTPPVHVEFELPEGGNWEFFVRIYDVERWERPYLTPVSQVKPSGNTGPKSKLVNDAAAKIWPRGLPELPPQVIFDKVADYVQEHSGLNVSKTHVLRTLGLK